MSTSEVKVRRTRLTPHKRKEALLEQSMMVFATQGIGRGAHSEVAQAAGVSVATVFNYFQSREDLLDQVLQQVTIKFERFLVDHIDESITARKNIENLTDGLIDLVKKDQHWIHIWFEWSACTRKDLGPLFQSSNLTSTEKLLQMFEVAKYRGEVCIEHKSMDLVNLLYALMNMLFTQACRNNSRRELKRLRNSVSDMLCIYQHAPNSSKHVKF